MYQYYKQTIVAAYQEFGFMFDYIDPDRNETKNPMYKWIKWFSNRLKNDDKFPEGFPIHKYNSIKIVASDQNYETNFGEKMLIDQQLRESVDVAGYHYNTDDGSKDQYKKLADKYKKQIWYSEGISPMTMGKYRVKATSGDGIGGKQSGLDIANRIIKSYVKSRRSCYIFQPAISAYYPGVNYSHKELINASHPWSGYFEVDNVGMQIMKHFSNFANIGWESDDSWRFLTSACDSGVGGTENLNKNTQAASYMTLMSSDKKNLSIIFVNDSAEPREYDINFDNLKALNGREIYVWRSVATNGSASEYDSGLMKCREKNSIQKGKVSLIIYPHSIVTITTLDRRYDSEAIYKRELSGKKNKLLFEDPMNNILYQERFKRDYSIKNGFRSVPKYTTDQGGAFEIVTNKGERYLQQMITEEKRALDWEYSYSCQGQFKNVCFRQKEM